MALGCFSVCIPIILIGTVYYRYAERMTLNQIEDEADSSLMLSQDRVEKILQALELDSYRLATSKIVQDSLDNSHFDEDLILHGDFIARGACHLYAADPIKCGGLLNAKRAATLCRAFGIHYVPHNTTRGIGFAAALHLAASTPECNSYYEYSIEKNNLRGQMLRTKFNVSQGRIRVPDGPGLGIEPDEEKMNSLLTVVK